MINIIVVPGNDLRPNDPSRKGLVNLELHSLLFHFGSRIGLDVQLIEPFVHVGILSHSVRHLKGCLIDYRHLASDPRCPGFSAIFRLDYP